MLKRYFIILLLSIIFFIFLSICYTLSYRYNIKAESNRQIGIVSTHITKIVLYPSKLISFLTGIKINGTLILLNLSLISFILSLITIKLIKAFKKKSYK